MTSFGVTEWKGQEETRTLAFDITLAVVLTHRVRSEVIRHCRAIVVFDQNRHIILNRDIIRKHVHIPMIII